VHVGPTANIDLFGRVPALTEVNVSMLMQGTTFTSVSYVDKDFSGAEDDNADDGDESGTDSV